MNISPIIPIGILLTFMLSGQVFPKQTLIAGIILAVIVLLYPLMIRVPWSHLCTCGL